MSTSKRRFKPLDEMLADYGSDIHRLKGALARFATRSELDFKLIGEAEADGTNISWPAITVPSGYRDLEIRWRAGHQGTGYRAVNLRFEQGGANTNHRYATKYTGDAIGGTTINDVSADGASRCVVGYCASTSLTAGGVIHIANYSVAGGAVPVTWQAWTSSGPSTARTVWGGGFYMGGPIQSIHMNASTDLLQAGSVVTVYGVGRA